MSTSPALDARLGDLAGRIGEFGTRIGELEKANARERHANDNGPRVESVGRKLVESDAFRALNGGRARGKAVVEVAAITTANTTVGAGRSQSTSLTTADRQPGIITAPERVMTVRDLIAPGVTGSNSIEYARETGFTNNAAPVAETTQKPYSDITFNMTSAPVRTLAHLFKASKQILDDADGLMSYIDVRARYGLAEKEDAQLLRGDGTGQNLNGLIPQASTFDESLRKVGDGRIEIIRRAILQVRRAEYRATGVVLSPEDLAELDLTKDANGQFLYASVINGGGLKVWRLAVTESSAMAPGEFLVGAFGIAAQVFDRQQATVEISTENTNDFELNMCTLRCEERLALAVYRPESFVYGSFEA